MTALESAIARLPGSDVSAVNTLTLTATSRRTKSCLRAEIEEPLPQEEEEDDELFPQICLSEARLRCLNIQRVLEEKAPPAIYV